MATILEETTAKFTAVVKDQNGVAVPASSLDTLQLTVYDQDTEVILRTTTNALNANGVTVDASGNLTWTLRPYETKISNLTIDVEDTEDKVALFEYSYSALKAGTLTNAFTTTLDSSLVSVSDIAHALAVNDSVIFVGVEDVGGLELDGQFLVVSITDANTYVIRHRGTATSTATGGGTCNYYYNGKVGKDVYKYKVKRVDVL